MTNQREQFEAAVVRRFETTKGYAEADIRTQCLERNGSGYVAEGINDLWHFWNEALWKNIKLVDPGFLDAPDGLDFGTPDEVFDKGPEAVREWQEARGREPRTPSPETRMTGSAAPYGWFVKDFADGWIFFDNEADAERQAEAAGAITLVGFHPAQCATPAVRFAKWLEDGPKLAKSAGCYVGITVSSATTEGQP